MRLVKVLTILFFIIFAFVHATAADAKKDLDVSVFQSKINKLHTTHSWEFLGIDSAQQYNQMPMESTSNIIVGVIDIARDGDGHGTHTASTIVGSIVANVSLFGMARALDNAISDDVDILSISIGSDPPQPSYFENAISIGDFHAIQRGILVFASAGNSAFPGTATNVAPWILTVATSSMNREFHSIVYLGNSKVLKPDITRPGLNILAAWSPVATTATTERSVDYNIISGTSMSCPHVSAVAAIVKSYQPS
ncbi:hypothetical protein CMV_009172 [Castanea mollissima]|uniref:Peptidase S8/S53 domain-containing protein n=1 Tax=Castanea mollissima TaxID=60419 RepID=A0A8J4RLG7_9ROSI|nr:hypothetical protein CMV_009172 [Castanea mollissima]